MTGLKLDDVRIKLNGQELLRLSETIAPGEILTVMGSSGSGKSSLLAYVGGFLDGIFSATGEIWLNDDTLTGLPSHERHTGIFGGRSRLTISMGKLRPCE